MNTIPDPETAVWLRDFDPAPDNFNWDGGNEDKNLKHGVTSDDIESILAQADCVFLGRIADPAHDEWRGVIL